MPPVICVGCGLNVDGLGVLQLDGPVSTAWPYDGSSDLFPLIDIAAGNGMRCDPVTEKVWSRPSSVSSFVRAQASLIGDTVGVGGVFFWSLDSDDFGPPNPWGDTGIFFDLSTLAQVSITNPSASRPAIVVGRAIVGAQAAALDSGVDIQTLVVGNMWDGLAVPYPGDLTLFPRTRWVGSNEVSPAILDFETTTPHQVEIARAVGASADPYFGSYLAPGETINFAAKLVGSMEVGTATNRNGQFFEIGYGIDVRLEVFSA